MKAPPPHRPHTPSHRAARGTLQLMIGRLVFLGCGYVVTIVLARGLGPAEYGIYGIILSVLVWTEQIGRFGVPEAVTKLIPEDERRAACVERTTQTLVLIEFLLLFVMAWLAAPFFSHLFQISNGTYLFRLAVVDLPLSGIYFAYQGILTGRRNFGALSMGLAIYGLTKLVGILMAWLLGLSIASALIVNILGTVGALVFLATRVQAQTLRFSLASIRIILHLAFPAGLLLLGSNVLATLDLWSLKVIGSEQGAIIGNYVAALNIARVPALVFSVVNAIVLPSISMALAQQNVALAQRLVQGAGRFLWVTLLPCCVLLALTAEELMVFLYSSRYAAGGSFLALQVVAFALFGVTQVFSEMLIARGNAYLAAGATLCHIPLALVLNVTLIPYVGALGAAMALMLTALLVTTVTGFLVFQRFGALIERSTVVKAGVATALMALVAIQVDVVGLWLLLKYVCLLSLYGVALLALGEVTWDDLRHFTLWRREPASSGDLAVE